MEGGVTERGVAESDVEDGGAEQGGPKGIFRGRYGASPLHLVGHLLLFAWAGYAVLQLLNAKAAADIFLWLLAAVLLHDLLLLPLYAGADRLSGGRLEGHAVNFFRVPAAVSGVLLLVYFPPILGLNDTTFLHAGGHRPAGYARDWLLITAGLFLVSGIVFLVRRFR